MIFQRKKNIIAGILQLYRNFHIIVGKIKFTLLLNFLITILLIIFIYFISMVSNGSFDKMIENLLIIFSLAALPFLFSFLSELFHYYWERKTSAVYNLESINLIQDGFLISYINSLNKEKILYQDIVKLSYAGYNSSARGRRISYIHFIIEYKDSEEKKKEVLIPLDVSGLPEFLKIVIEKAGLVKVNLSQSSFIFAWKKPNSGEKLNTVDNTNLRFGGIDPNKDLFSMFK